jgi:hypothetical protein
MFFIAKGTYVFCTKNLLLSSILLIGISIPTTSLHSAFDYEIAKSALHSVFFPDTLQQHPYICASSLLIPLLAYCIFSYNCKSADKNFHPRYSLTFKNIKLRSINSLDDLMEQMMYAIKNIYWILEDGVIGIPGNSSNALQVDLETKKIEVKQRSNPAGLFGWIQAYSKAIVNTATAPYELGKIALKIAIGVYIWKNIFSLVPAIKQAIEEVATEKVIQKAFCIMASNVLK